MWWTTMHGHTELVLYSPRKRKNICSDSHKDFDRVRLSGRPETETDIVFPHDTGELLLDMNYSLIDISSSLLT